MKKILVIDDDDMVRTTIVRVLQSQGYQVVTARDGEQGLRVHRREMPDLVITDILMPEKEGIETIMTIKKEQPNARIIAISGGGRFGDADVLEMAKQLGACHSIAKPVEPEELLRSVSRCLSDC